MYCVKLCSHCVTFKGRETIYIIQNCGCKYSISEGFLTHLVYIPMSLSNHDLSIVVIGIGVIGVGICVQPSK